MRDFLKSPLPESLDTRAEKAAYACLAGAVCLSLVSIAACQILLAAALAASIPLFRNALRKIFRQRFLLPLVLFFMWTVMAALASRDPLLGLGILRKFYLFLLLFIVPHLLRGPGRADWIFRAVFVAAVMSSLAGVTQFALDPDRDLLHRISGFMSHWMTYSGLLMLAVVAIAAYGSVYGLRRNRWTVGAALILAIPITLSQTRNAILGAIAGMALILLLRRPRAIAGLAVLVMALFFASPSHFQQRIRAGWDLNDPNTRNRIELLGTSIRLIQENPWFGVGPKNVQIEALRYRGSSEFPDWLYQHMHNNFLQIAAERGLPGLLLWTWLMGRFAWDALVLFRRATLGQTGDSRQGTTSEALLVSTAALGAWAALLTAGFFEYNFGDSEVLTLFLFLMAAPYAFLQDNSHRPEEMEHLSAGVDSDSKMPLTR